MTTPTNLPEWAIDDITLSSGTANKVRPQEALRNNGYDVDEEPTAQELNWQLNNIYQWIKDLDVRITTETLALADVYPVGSTYINFTDSTNPATLFGFGTWVEAGIGQMLLGADDSVPSPTYPAGQVGGEATHAMTVDEMPAHSHTVRAGGGSSGPRQAIAYDSYNSFNVSTTSVGSGQPHNNLPPYVSVYMWQRTA